MMLTDKEIGAIFRKLVVVDDDGLIYGLEEACRAVIAANNAKVLADLKPVGHIGKSEYEWLVKGDTVSAIIRARNPMFGDGQIYSADQVSALIQRNEELAARVKELNDLLAKSLVTNMQLKATP